MLNSTTPYLNLGLLIIIIILCCIAIQNCIYWIIRQRFHTKIKQLYKASDIILTDFKSNSLGRKSRGILQRKGNGALILTKSGIHFFQLAPNKEILIPLDSVTGINVIKEYLGKSIGFKLLHIAFAANDVTDSMTWYVTDLQLWIYEIRKLLDSDKKIKKNRFYIPAND